MISVIVPVYNSQKYLDRCINSILNQNFRDFELILIDDGSTDESPAMCDKYAHKYSRIKAIHKQNEGVSKARNTGICNATGDFITFVDSDDYISETMLSQLMACVDDNADMVIGSVKMISEAGENQYLMRDSLVSTKALLEDYLSEAFPRICLNGPCVKLFRKDIIDKYNIRFDSAMSLGEDTVFVTEYLSHCEKIRTTDKAVYFYMRDNENSLYSRFRGNWYDDSYKAYTAVTDIAEDFECSEAAMKIYRGFRVRNLLATLIVAVRTSGKEECVLYMKALSEDEVFCGNMRTLNKRSMYITAKLIQLKLYGLVYFALRLRYKNRK